MKPQQTWVRVRVRVRVGVTVTVTVRLGLGLGLVGLEAAADLVRVAHVEQRIGARGHDRTCVRVRIRVRVRVRVSAQ